MALTPKIDPRLKAPPTEAAGNGRDSLGDDIPRVDLWREFDSFERIDRQKPEHLEALEELFPRYLFHECMDEDWQEFRRAARYDPKHGCLVAGCYDSLATNAPLVSYKHRKIGTVKWKVRAGTHPNHVLYLRILSPDRPIYGVEGHHDMLSALLLGIDFIMLPTAGYRLREAEKLKQMIEERQLVFLVEDKPAFTCMGNLAHELEDAVSSIVLRTFNDGSSKMDLSDFLFSQPGIKEALHALEDR